MVIGYIYKITNKVNSLCYIGSTFKTLDKRMMTHINHYKSYKNGKSKWYYLFDIFEEVGIDNCEIELITQIEAKDRNAIRKIERNWYEWIPNSNKNKPYLYKHEHNEYFKRWRNDHKGYMKAWSLINNGYFEKYRQNNLISVPCICGKVLRVINGNLNKHIKTKKHLEFLQKKNE